MSVQEKWEEQRRRRYAGFHAMYDYVMGLLWLFIGLFFLLNKTLGIEWMKSDPIIDNIFGFVGIVYGIFRLYRGYKKKYFRK